MMEFPSTPWREHDEAGTPAASASPLPGPWRKVAGRVEHTFTHFRLVLDMRAADFPKDIAPPGDDYRWVAAEALSNEALPTVMRKVAAHMGVTMTRRN
jgi:A/G-specific adenine glycosylase